MTFADWSEQVFGSPPDPRPEPVSEDRGALRCTLSFLRRSWPLEMLPEVEACEREIETAVDLAYHDERMDATLKRAVRAEVALARLKDPDPLVLNAATRASLQGVNLAPVPIERAIEDPRNREAIRRALNAAVDQVTS